MKPEDIPQRAFQLAQELGLGAALTRDLVACFGAADPNFCRFLAAAAEDAGLAGEERLARGSGIFFQYLAIQVSDDLSDGDCTYLPDAAQVAPALLLVLQHLFHRALLTSEVPRAVLLRAAEDFLHVGAAQTRELRTRTWNFERARDAATGLNAMQFAAYLRLLWSDTALAPRAESIGTHLGIAVHVASDVRSRDRRFCSLSAEDQERLVAWAEVSLHALEQEKLASVERVVPTIRAALAARELVA